MAFAYAEMSAAFDRFAAAEIEQADDEIVLELQVSERNFISERPASRCRHQRRRHPGLGEVARVKPRADAALTPRLRRRGALQAAAAAQNAGEGGMNEKKELSSGRNAGAPAASRRRWR